MSERLDEYGRPKPYTGAFGVQIIPPAGFFKLRFVRKGPWLPARIAWEQTTDPEGRLCDRWSPILRVMAWSWVRGEIMAWASSLHPIDGAEFKVLCARPLPCGPLETFDIASAPPAL